VYVKYRREETGMKICWSSTSQSISLLGPWMVRSLEHQLIGFVIKFD